MPQGTGRDAISVRGHNLRTLLGHVHRFGPTTRAQLGEITGLTRSAVGDLVAELTAREYVLESAVDDRAGRGRRSLLVAPDSRAKVLAISIGAETLRAAWVGLGGVVEAITEVPHNYVPDDPRPSMVQLAKLVQAQLDAAAAPPLAVGLAVPGLVRSSDGVVVLAPRLGWRELSLADELRKRIEIDVPIVTGNDSNFAALAEHLRGAGRGHGDMVYLQGGLGVGGGIIFNDGQVPTALPAGSEIGHMVTESNGAPCYCGGYGCWQTQVGGEALLKHAGIAAADARERRAVLNDLLQRADRDDLAAVSALAAIVPAIAAGIATLLAVFDPDEIILDGVFASVLRHCEGQLRAAIVEHRPVLTTSEVELVAAELGASAPLLGAAETAIRAFLNGLSPYGERIRVPRMIGA